MNEPKAGFLATIRSFPPTFWVANTMEIFERMAWYGFFAVSSLYITGPVETGGLGFTSEQRGQLQAIVPFILYLLPVITGALADRYGYKKMFIIAYVGMVIFYYALGQFKTFPTFLGAFLCVALAAAIFKPVVVGTVARVTSAGNSSMGFGIFYMMVNIGGFLGPLVAGAVRGISWNYVFIACSTWAAINLVIVIIFYRDPSTEATSTQKRTLGKVARDMVEVLGNMRFGICVFTVLIALMLANQGLEWFSWKRCWIFIGMWLVLNALWDLSMPQGSGNPAHPASAGRPFFLKRMHCSNWRFAMFLLIMSGFWTSFNQIFLTMPEYIRDFTDTRPMVQVARNVSESVSGFARRVVGGVGLKEQANKIENDAFLNALAAIEQAEVLQEFDRLVRLARGVEPIVPEPTRTKQSNAKSKAAVMDKIKKLLEDREIDDAEKERLKAARESLEAEKSDTSDPATQPAESPPATQRKLPGPEADEAAQALLAAVDDADHETPDKVQALVDRAEELRDAYAECAPIRAVEELVDSIERAKRTRMLPKDPSLSPAVLQELQALVATLNVSGATKPLETIDLVESARTILQYKVRVEPLELARFVAAVGSRVDAVSDADLTTAVRSINRRLEQRGKPLFKDGDAERLRTELRQLLLTHGPLAPRDAVRRACAALPNGNRDIEPDVLALGIRDLAYRPVIWDRIDAGRQVNPEHIVNFDALAIVLLQVVISFMMARFHRFTTMIVGMVIAAVGIGLSSFAGGTMIGPLGGSLLVVVAGIVIFAVGEMMASPTSQEYVGRIAPQDRVAVYMGYYFVAVALGNLFGGILSGQLYGKLARDMQRPDLMWACFGGLMLLTAVIFLLYDRFALPRSKPQAKMA
ncbi:MAG: MFS transporter [Phycisphaerae bacterium]|nr:MFS transporter [Phycisphaerae bacterium]NUQ45302.1 MFS transporter [Phycisphaerae bacterium]